MSEMLLTAVFPDEQSAHAWAEAVRAVGLEPPRMRFTVQGRGKRNGPKLARWLAAHPGWHAIGEAANRRAALKAAYKITSGVRRGFELGGYEARVRQVKGTWLVEARAVPKRPAVADDAASMRPLF
ncbi:hypothetical protein CSQ85_09205 [Bifidobacterium rousetti]|uniref:hypothetical protein n=1 Tax=Bifidobacterium rousetti TaxID=2045439 RepID=UPI00123BAE2B|nr:hypothetical protein [Bifidobacterium rousetti]KAA8818328.1 hypothetical protein CSQ85_09205 [Bifidobacterium rousetti]